MCQSFMVYPSKFRRIVMANGKTRKVGRDAGNGQFIPLKEAKKRPETTVIETVPVPDKKKKK